MFVHMFKVTHKPRSPPKSFKKHDETKEKVMQLLPGDKSLQGCCL